MGKVKSVVLRKKTEMETYSKPVAEKVTPVVEEPVVEVKKKTTKAEKPAKKSKVKKSDKDADTKERV